MGEKIKPDYCLSLKRKWFAKIWNGEKSVEYRAVTPKYKRLATWIGEARGVFMMFYIGMMKTGPRMLVQVSKIDVGPCPLEGFDGEYEPPTDWTLLGNEIDWGDPVGKEAW